ncbi:unnamed protein product [Cuscuta campestris]|uniref:Nuclear pore complex protein NUP214 n=1 Tax=Cuscuta campestris TaxID=132261 RepID=A0A484K647_9ASTE|nr:unnamed protein product [Cuscuta campestris]
MAPSTSQSNAKASSVELDEEIQGDSIVSSDYRFSRIGLTIPVKSDGSSPFDTENEVPPLQPLAVSERFRLTFVAHSDGFYVARTSEVLASAKELKEKNSRLSVQEICIVDISIGRVSILALSGDESLLAATVGSKIYFFPVSTILHKEQDPSFSFSIDGSSFIKDMQWAKQEEKIYLVLSSEGKLFCGRGQNHANCVMDNVDAVGWNRNGDRIAVVKDNTISIMSSQFEEMLSLVPSFSSFLNDCHGESVVKVDTVRWVRPDSIVLGCICMNDDEDTYALQVITSKNGKIDDDSSKPVVQSFTDAFADYHSDVVPLTSGPHLFCSYLDNLGLAFAANRRNLDQHILLFGWSVGEGTNKNAMIEIQVDSWHPKILSQEAGDDIFVLGLAIDKVSQQKGLKLLLGNNEEKEVSPCCVLLCLASDGGLSVFHFASARSESVTSPVIACPDENDNISTVLLSEVMKKDVEDIGWKPNDLDVSESDRKAAETVQKCTQPSMLSLEGFETRNLGAKPLPKLVIEDKNKLFGQIPSQVTSANTSAVALPEAVRSHIISEVKEKHVEDMSLKSNDLNVSESGLKAAGVAQRSTQQHDIRNINQEANPLLNLSNEEHLKSPPSKLSQDRDKPQSPLRVKQDKDLEDPSLDASHAANTESPCDSLSVKSMHTSAEAKNSIGSASVKPSNDYSQLIGKSTQRDSLVAVQERTVSTGFSNGASSTGSLRNDKSSPLQTFGNTQQKDACNSDRTMLPFPGGHLQSAIPWTQTNSASVDSSKQRVMPWAQSIKSSSSLEQNVSLEKSSKLQPARDSSERIRSKQFHNVEDMTRKLDGLLQDIKGEGGFMDASISSQESSVVTLEEGIHALSSKCRTWRGIVSEQNEEIHLLFDKTVKVLAKKVYMEGIFKQATDSRYLDMWSRQKLCPELDLKQVHIKDMQKVLTNQLIELEKHFNILELNTFGRREGISMNRRSSQSNHEQGRHTHSLHSLRGTVNAQLAAAEQLSGNLSKLMTDLNIKSTACRHNVRKEMFETIGLSYEDSTNSTPGKEMILSTPLNRERSVSFTANEQSWRKQTNATKSSEPETARRRRDSLDRNWACFEPPKTTVKRILLQEDYKKASATRSSLSAYKQRSDSKSHERSTIAASNVSGASSTSQQKFKTTEISEEICSRSSARSLWSDDSGKSAEKLPSAINFSMPPSLDETKSTFSGQNIREGVTLTNENATSATCFTGNSTPGQSKLIQQPETKLQKASIDSQNSNLTIRGEKDAPISRGGLQTESKTSSEFSFSAATSADSASSFSGKLTNREIVENKRQTTEIVVATSGKSLSFPTNPIFPLTPNLPPSASPSLQDLLHSPSPSKTSLPSISDKFPSGELASDNLLSIPKAISYTTQSSSVSQSPSVASQKSSFNFPITQEVGPSLVTPDSKRHDPKSLSQLPTTDAASRDTISRPQQSLPNVASNSQAGLLAQSKSTNEHPSKTQSESPPITSSFSSLAFGVGLNEKEKESTSQSVSGGKTENTAGAVFEEDEMEEEAPEMNQVTEQTLGNLAGFGFGVPTNVSNAKPNPFGTPLPNNTPSQTSTTFTMAAPPDGELFRPASFSFPSLQPSQPPTSFNSLPGGFAPGNASQTPGSGFGKPSQIGPGNSALGSVLGSFGQSRQLGTGLPGSASPPAGGSVAGFPTNNNTAGGFSSGALAVGGGFSKLASAGGGFAAAATGGGGFAAAATASGFGAPAAGTGVAGFGGFSNQQQQPGGGGFSAFGNPAAARPSSQLFTQMRK